jgi:hypothetical protein
MNNPIGKLSGLGEVRGPNGELRGTFVLTAECTPEQADCLAKDLALNLETPNKVIEYGYHAR